MIGIVGGGISGLVLAYELRHLGADVTVWEAASVPGGVMRSQLHGDLILELGPQRARLSDSFRQLVESVGLTGELVTAPTDLPLYVYYQGRLRRAPLSFSQAVTTDLLPWWAKARVLAEPFTSGPRVGERVGPFLRRKFGGAAYRTLLGPLYGGLYASDPDSHAGKARAPKDPGGAWCPEEHSMADVPWCGSGGRVRALLLPGRVGIASACDN